jgi:hypothetical protein
VVNTGTLPSSSTISAAVVAAMPREYHSGTGAKNSGR